MSGWDEPLTKSAAQKANEKHAEHAAEAVRLLDYAAEVDDRRNGASYLSWVMEAQVHATLAASWASKLTAEALA